MKCIYGFFFVSFDKSVIIEKTLIIDGRYICLWMLFDIFFRFVHVVRCMTGIVGLAETLDENGISYQKRRVSCIFNGFGCIFNCFGIVFQQVIALPDHGICYGYIFHTTLQCLLVIINVCGILSLTGVEISC